MELVTMQRQRVVTTSVKVAEVFRKRHKNVLRAIETVECSAEFRRLNFEPRSYVDKRGKTWPMFQITRDGFTFLAMGFTGKNAAKFKEDYISAFNRMEQTLLNQRNLSWQEARKRGKAVRHDETDTIARFVDYAARQGSANAGKYYVNLTALAYRALFVTGTASPQATRDLLSDSQLALLATAELLIRTALGDGMGKSLPYRDVFRLAHDQVMAFAAQLPPEHLLVSPVQGLLFQ